MSDFDTIVLGAGAAGLAAATTLAQHARSVCLVEARDRVGGRIFTRHSPECAIPIELGAEFIHGRSPATMRWLSATDLTMLDVSGDRWTLRNGELRAGDNTFMRMKRGLERTPLPQKDLPFGDFLRGPARKYLSPAARELARSLVEGFDAADATRVSTLNTLKVWRGSGAADAPTFRPLGGYGALMQGMAARLPENARLLMNSAVRTVEWERKRVAVTVAQGNTLTQITARHAVVTLPLGVLQAPASAAYAVSFAPHLKEKQSALAKLGNGPAVKLTLQFHAAFWERIRRGRYCNAGFFIAPQSHFRTFWSQLPYRAPMLVAWAGGPQAAQWTERSADDIVDAALGSLQAVLGRRASLRDELRAAHFHDWQSDPYARGAYSYVLAGGAKARVALARPLLDTLFFAGEAADISGESGTVAGALQSGTHAAELILRQREPHRSA